MHAALLLTRPWAGFPTANQTSYNAGHQWHAGRFPGRRPPPPLPSPRDEHERPALHQCQKLRERANMYVCLRVYL